MLLPAVEGVQQWRAVDNPASKGILSAAESGIKMIIQI